MAYGSTEGNYFQAKQNNNQGVPTTTNFSLVVEDNTQGAKSGLITIYAENGTRVVGTIPRGGSFIPNPSATNPTNELKAEFNYFSQQDNITAVKTHAIITVQRSLSKTADPNQTPAQREAIARSVVFGPQQGANEDGSVVSPTSTPTSRETQQNGSETISLSDLSISQIQADDEYRKKWWYGIDRLIYPTDISKNKQDYIEFNIFEYVTRGRNQTNPLLFGERTLQDSKINIILPIQPSITDTSTVDWNSSSLNPVEMGLYSLSSDIMTAQGQRDEIIKSMGNTITQDQNAQKALLLYLKQKAIGTTGLVSRFGGAVVNPNMELLFQGPQLRPFNFSFRLSPRDDGEAKIVKRIIRVFKEAMAVRTASNGIFLAAPHIFNISYKNGALNKEHTSLNKIKTCALQSCSVDYTPDGSYMTFNDTTNGNPMTSYNLTLQFQELEPVTDKDYATVSADQIGY